MRRLLTAFALLVVTASASAQGLVAKPSFDGHWVLDVNKSESEGAPLPAAISWKFAQHGDTLVFDRELTNEAGGAKLVSTVTVAMDGKPWPNKIPQPDGTTRIANYTISWEGRTMVMTITSEVQGAAIVQVDRLTKSADGTTLTVARTLSVDGEDAAKATMVFVPRP